MHEWLGFFFWALIIHQCLYVIDLIYSSELLCEGWMIYVFSSEMIMSYSSNWITLLLLCTGTPLVLCCDRCDCGSRQIKRDLVDLVTVDYDITLHWRLLTAHEDDTNGGNHRPLLCYPWHLLSFSRPAN